MTRESIETEMIATFREAEIDSKQWSPHFNDLDTMRTMALSNQ